MHACPHLSAIYLIGFTRDLSCNTKTTSKLLSHSQMPLSILSTVHTRIVVAMSTSTAKHSVMIQLQWCKSVELNFKWVRAE